MVNGRGVYWHGNRDKKMVALTFDDGPHRKCTPLILDILKMSGVRATFFLVGDKILPNKDIVKRIISEGHEIGNHTYSHKKLPNLKWNDIKREITKTDIVLKKHFNIT